MSNGDVGAKKKRDPGELRAGGVLVVKAGLLRRLARIEGQVRGIGGMIESEREAADVLTQIAAVQAGLKRVSRDLLNRHLRLKMAEGFESTDPAHRAQTAEEATELVLKYGR